MIIFFLPQQIKNRGEIVLLVRRLPSRLFSAEIPKLMSECFFLIQNVALSCVDVVNDVNVSDK